jgi:Ca2+-binding RTX toxin-like protein
MARSLTFIVDGPVDTQITVTEAGGNLVFEATAINGGGQELDYRGLFFDVNADAAFISGLDVSIGGEITDFAAKNDAIDTLGRDANIKGEVINTLDKFDVGVEIGTAGMATDDISTYSFTLTHNSTPLSLDLISQVDFGVRATSVGFAGSRNDSFKVGGQSTAAPDAIDDHFCEGEDTCISGNVLLNDTDTDNDALTITAVNGIAADIGNPVTLANGILTLNADGSFDFVPTTSFTGNQTFEYTINDGNGGTDSALATIKIDEVLGITIDLQDEPTNDRGETGGRGEEPSGPENIDGTVGRDTLSGNSNSNTISGNKGADLINGEDGNDVLIGGTGNDMLTGGLGEDIFVFEDADKFRGTDTITDYVDGVDTLQLSGFGALGFEDLIFSDDGSGNAQISVFDGKTDEVIAELTGVDFNVLDVTDFTFV